VFTLPHDHLVRSSRIPLGVRALNPVSPSRPPGRA
jgi:hypothetical protein